MSLLGDVKLCGGTVGVGTTALALLANFVHLLVHLCPVMESVLSSTGHSPGHTSWMPGPNARNLHHLHPSHQNFSTNLTVDKIAPPNKCFASCQAEHTGSKCITVHAC